MDEREVSQLLGYWLLVVGCWLFSKEIKKICMKKIILFLTVLALIQIASAQKKSSIINRFQTYITGDFDNSAQVVAEIKAGKQIHPLAVHVNRLSNGKIKNIPSDLNGFFIIEESYYLAEGKPIDLKPYLFLFEEKVAGIVHLTTFQLTGLKKEEVRNDNSSLQFDFNQLQPSTTFKGADYTWNPSDKTFNTISPNDLGNGMKFTLTEKFTNKQLTVLEQVEKDGKLLTAWNTPIIYLRTRQFGELKGIINNIPSVPYRDTAFLIKVALPNGLITNYKKQILFSNNLSGTAEIITENASLADRLLY